MIWRVGKVHDFDLGDGFIPSPGFTIQQEGRAPALTLIFEDLENRGTVRLGHARDRRQDDGDQGA